ncbi:DUF2254 domain-containing protein [bacterium]|nr:DUF2254 domain-containing protein [bacterium]
MKPSMTFFRINSEKKPIPLTIDNTALFEVACKSQLLVQLEAHPGSFFFKGQILARVLPAAQGSQDLSDSIRETFIFGSHRTNTQDIEFIFTQLRSIAVRSLSPGINDPFTATMVIDAWAKRYMSCSGAVFPPCTVMMRSRLSGSLPLPSPSRPYFTRPLMGFGTMGMLI